jgi:hypothetical protein
MNEMREGIMNIGFRSQHVLLGTTFWERTISVDTNLNENNYTPEQEIEYHNSHRCVSSTRV